MGSKPRKPDADDLALWKEAMREAKPIRRRAVAPTKTAIPDRPAGPAAVSGIDDAPPAARVAKSGAPNASKSPAARPPKPEPKPLERGQVAGVDKRQAERLRRGRTGIEARIDLHGLTLESAHRKLTAFLEHAQEAGQRAVLVVTGKGVREGTGVIRAQVPRWLNEPRLRPLVLAYEYAQPKDGGMGALYILLRKKR